MVNFQISNQWLILMNTNTEEKDLDIKDQGEVPLIIDGDDNVLVHVKDVAFWVKKHSKGASVHLWEDGDEEEEDEESEDEDAGSEKGEKEKRASGSRKLTECSVPVLPVHKPSTLQVSVTQMRTHPPARPMPAAQVSEADQLAEALKCRPLPIPVGAQPHPSHPLPAHQQSADSVADPSQVPNTITK